MMQVRALEIPRDVALVHDWLTRPYAHYWGMTNSSVQDVHATYVGLTADPHQRAVIGELDDRPVFLAELYDPAHSELAEHYAVRPGDLGMHFLVAPPAGPRTHGFSLEVIRTVMRHCFADPAVRRVVVEPDARNAKVHVLNAAVGFVPSRQIDLPTKRALLSFCTRAAFAATTIEEPV